MLFVFQWLPYKCSYQALYLIYRWFLSIYFLFWIVTGGEHSGSPKILRYLTHWAFIAFNSYLFVAALSSTLKHLSMHASEEREEERKLFIVSKKPAGCCGYDHNELTWYQMIQWFLFIIGNEGAFIIMILYCSFVLRGQNLTPFSINHHIINGIISIIDFWVTGVPANLLHFIYPIICGVIYVTFSGIYFTISGDIIYSVLDYDSRPGAAVGLSLAVILLFLPFVHFIIFLQYVIKCWLLFYCTRFKQKHTGRVHDQSV